MITNEVINMVGQSCRPDQAADLVKWYEVRHIPDLMKNPGLKRAHRAELLYDGKSTMGYPEQNYPMFLNIYEFDDQQAFEDYTKGLSRPRGMPSGGQVPYSSNDPVERVWRVQYKIVRVWER